MLWATGRAIPFLPRPLAGVVHCPTMQDCSQHHPWGCAGSPQAVWEMPWIAMFRFYSEETFTRCDLNLFMKTAQVWGSARLSHALSLRVMPIKNYSIIESIRLKKSPKIIKSNLSPPHCIQ